MAGGRQHVFKMVGLSPYAVWVALLELFLNSVLVLRKVHVRLIVREALRRRPGYATREFRDDALPWIPTGGSTVRASINVPRFYFLFRQ